MKLPDAAEEGLKTKEFGYSPEQEKERQGIISTVHIERQLAADAWGVPVLTACRLYTRTGS